MSMKAQLIRNFLVAFRQVQLSRMAYLYHLSLNWLRFVGRLGGVCNRNLLGVRMRRDASEIDVETTRKCNFWFLDLDPEKPLGDL